uniref:Uncharacterized protein n=1 Tax=Ananas comosus var. bracteatus TaxID=296719 RepID=A0A6V7P2N0_ANACO|nr:unnamed protein product [Ananas comosus var. bracteatus]
MSMLRRRKPSEAEKKPSASSDADADADAESSKGKAKKSPSSSSSAAAAAAVGEGEGERKGKGGRWSCVDSCCWTIGWICSAWWILIFLYNAVPPRSRSTWRRRSRGRPRTRRGEAPEGGARGEAPGGVRPRDRHRGARALGGPPLRRGALPQAPLGRILRRDL